MVRAINNRELITVTAGGERLRGTYHKPSTQAARVGILWINSGWAPRAAFGDAAVGWADSFARQGYPCFRLDLPGLGDSEGTLPEKWLDLCDLINNGHFVSHVSGAATNLAARHHLSGMVLMGHCGGAVSAIYAAAANPDIQGVVALDPYFFRNVEQRPAFRQELSIWVTRSKMAGRLSKIYKRVKRFNVLIANQRIPENANLTLLRSWQRVAGSGKPTLLLAPKRSLSQGEFDYWAYLEELPGAKSRVEVKYIEGAHHSFGDAVGRPAVRNYASQWLDTYFGEHGNEEPALAEQFAAGRE